MDLGTRPAMSTMTSTQDRAALTWPKDELKLAIQEFCFCQSRLAATEKQNSRLNNYRLHNPLLPLKDSINIKLHVDYSLVFGVVIAAAPQH